MLHCKSANPELIADHVLERFCRYSLTLLGDLGQFFDLGNLPLAFLGVEMLGPRTPIVLVHCIPGVFRDTIVILNPTGNRKKNIQGPSDQYISVKLKTSDRDKLTLPVRRPLAKPDQTVVPYV